MKVDVRNLSEYESEDRSFSHKVKTKKKHVPNEFRKNDNRKFNKPKHVNKDFED